MKDNLSLILTGMLILIYDLLLFFSPYAVLHFVFNMQSIETKVCGFGLGIFFCMTSGLTLNTGKIKNKTEE